MVSSALFASDSSLLDAVQKGDERAFEALFLRYYDRVYAILFRLLGSKVEAEDMLQEVFLKLYRHSFPVGRDHNLSSWLYRVALNEGYNFLRSQARRSKREDESERQNSVDLNARQNNLDPAEAALLTEQRLLVRSVLADLPERQRSCLVLKATGFSYAEIAHVLEVSSSSVGTLLARAEESFKKIYVALSEKGGPL